MFYSRLRVDEPSYFPEKKKQTKNKQQKNKKAWK